MNQCECLYGIWDLMSADIWLVREGNDVQCEDCFIINYPVVTSKSVRSTSIDYVWGMCEAVCEWGGSLSVVFSSCHWLRDLTVSVFGVNAKSKAFTILCSWDSEFLGGLGQQSQVTIPECPVPPFLLWTREKTVAVTSWSIMFRVDSEASKNSYKKKLIYKVQLPSRLEGL